MPALSSEVKTFLEKHIRSVEELEVFLFLRNHRDKDWDVVEVAESVGGDPVSISDNLMRLYLKGLLGHPENRKSFYRYRYRVETAMDEEDVAKVASAYELARNEVVDFLFKKNRRQLEAFAEAFRVVKQKD